MLFNVILKVILFLILKQDYFVYLFVHSNINISDVIKRYRGDAISTQLMEMPGVCCMPPHNKFPCSAQFFFFFNQRNCKFISISEFNLCG